MYDKWIKIDLLQNKHCTTCWVVFIDLYMKCSIPKVITPLFVKIELLVPMCSVTPLVSWNQLILFEKKKKKTFVSIIGISGILYSVSFVKNC